MGAVAGAVLGFVFYKGHTTGLMRLRARLVREQGKKVLNEPDVSLNAWVADPSKLRRAKYLYVFVGAFVAFCNTFPMYYPVYLEEVASMPNSKMALGIKRMHRQLYLRDSVAMNAVSEESVGEARTRYESKMIGEDRPVRDRATVPAELAASAGLAGGLGGGYKAGG